MMIKTSDAECRNGMARAELRYQLVAKAAAAPKPVANVIAFSTRVSETERQSRAENPTGRVQQAFHQRAVAAL